MIKRITGFFIVLVLLAFSVNASAQIRPGTFNIGPMFGVGMFEGNQDLDNAPVIGIRGGYDFTDRWGVEGTINWIPTKYNYESSMFIPARPGYWVTFPDSAHTNVFNYRIEAVYNFMPSSQLVPFIAAGIGGQTIDYRGGVDKKDKTRFAADYGVGLKYFLTETLAIRADVRHVLAIGSIYNDLEATIGMAFYFGGKKEAPAPPPPPPVAAAEKKILEEGRITLNIEFDFDKAQVRPQHRDEIKDVADFMIKYPSARFSIEGHTCSMGTAEYNQRLSQRRADSVKKYMIDNFNIEANRLESIGYGESRPIADNSTEAGRERNRRVEAVRIE